MLTYTPSKNKPQSGFSLIELLVALGISLFLLLGISYIYTGSKQTYRVEENLARMQESGRLAFEYLSRDIRSAGDFGCPSKNLTSATAIAGTTCTGWPTDSKLQPMICTLDNGNCAGTTAAKLNLNPARSVFGYESSGPSDVTSIAANTDSIIITSSTPTSAAITQDNAGTLTVNTSSELTSGDILIASDCKSSVVFQACSLPSTTTINHSKDKSGGCAATGNVCTNWDSSIYGNLAGGSILKAVRNIYYTNGSSLYRRNVKNTEIELVPNIENLQITYGVAATADASANQYVAAGSVTDWSLVKSVHIELLVRSPDDNLTTAKQKYYFNGADVTATDNRLRLTMGTTISIRNRTLASIK